jgi:hypothetical protein
MTARRSAEAAASDERRSREEPRMRTYAEQARLPPPPMAPAYREGLVRPAQHGTDLRFHKRSEDPVGGGSTYPYEGSAPVAPLARAR